MNRKTWLMGLVLGISIGVIPSARIGNKAFAGSESVPVCEPVKKTPPVPVCGPAKLVAVKPAIPAPAVCVPEKAPPPIRVCKPIGPAPTVCRPAKAAPPENPCAPAQHGPVHIVLSHLQQLFLPQSGYVLVPEATQVKATPRPAGLTAPVPDAPQPPIPSSKT